MRFLRYLFPKQQNHIGLAIENINTAVPEEIITAITKDTQTLLEKTMHYNRAILLLGETSFSPARSLERYVEIKQIEEKILTCITRYSTNEYTPAQTKILHTLNTAIVQLLTSSKYLKDTAHHLDNIHDQPYEPIMQESYDFFQQMVGKTTNAVYAWMEDKTMTRKIMHEHINTHIAGLHSDADIFIGGLSTKLNQESEKDINIAEVIKVNYYIMLSSESLLR